MILQLYNDTHTTWLKHLSDSELVLWGHFPGLLVPCVLVLVLCLKLQPAVSVLQKIRHISTSFGSCQSFHWDDSGPCAENTVKGWSVTEHIGFCAALAQESNQDQNKYMWIEIYLCSLLSRYLFVSTSCWYCCLDHCSSFWRVFWDSRTRFSSISNFVNLSSITDPFIWSCCFMYWRSLRFIWLLMSRTAMSSSNCFLALISVSNCCWILSLWLQNKKLWHVMMRLLDIFAVNGDKLTLMQL